MRAQRNSDAHVSVPREEPIGEFIEVRRCMEAIENFQKLRLV